MKTCVKCKKDKEKSLFSKSKDRKDGLNPYCKDCTKEWRELNKEYLASKKKEYYEANKLTLQIKSREKYARNKDKYLSQIRDYYSVPENYLRKALARIKKRSEVEGLEFNISIEDLPVTEYCKYLGIKLTYKLGEGQLPSNASVDRIDPSKGYIKGNVEIISRKANTMKSNATKQELLIFSRKVLENFGEKA